MKTLPLSSMSISLSSASSIFRPPRHRLPTVSLLVLTLDIRAFDIGHKGQCHLQTPHYRKMLQRAGLAIRALSCKRRAAPLTAGQLPLCLARGSGGSPRCSSIDSKRETAQIH